MLGFSSAVNIPREKAYSYEIVTPALAPAVTLAEFKAYAKITNTAQDTTLQIILDSAIAFGESYTRRVFVTTEFKTFRDEFLFRSNTIELRKSRFIAISTNGFQYFDKDNVLVDVDPTIFYTTEEQDYSKIVLLNDEDWPEDLTEDRPLQNVQITFTAGYGDTAATVPQELRIAIMAHALHVVKNRGDCAECKCEGDNLPPEARMIYKKFKIREIRVGF